MLNQKKLEIFLVKIRKSLAKQFLEVASTNKTLSYNYSHNWTNTIKFTTLS